MKNFRKILLILILIITCLIALFIFLFKIKSNTFLQNEDKKENDKLVFSINKISFFSSADADIEINQSTNFNNLIQYTDIALFINNKNSFNEFSAENTLKELYISNIQFSTLPELGTPNLYYKNINDFATSKYNAENIVTDNYKFNISSEDEIDYSLPILYNNCANPITLSYVNSGIVDNYSIANSSTSFFHDGSLIKKCNVLISSINCELSFDIFLVNNLGQKYKCPVNISIPLITDDSSIYKGNLQLEQDVNFVFERQY